MNNIKIEVASDKNTYELTQLYRKLYKGDEEQKFFNSKALPSHFVSGSRVFVAKDNGKIVGFLWAVFYEHIKNKGVGIIEELYVDEKYRRKGIGKMLVFKAINFLKKHSTVIFVTTGLHMHDAIKFYKAIGFKESKVWFFYPIEQSKGSRE